MAKLNSMHCPHVLSPLTLLHPNGKSLGIQEGIRGIHSNTCIHWLLVIGWRRKRGRRKKEWWRRMHEEKEKEATYLFQVIESPMDTEISTAS
jgi:hypothetical protein